MSLHSFVMNQICHVKVIGLSFVSVRHFFASRVMLLFHTKDRSELCWSIACSDNNDVLATFNAWAGFLSPAIIERIMSVFDESCRESCELALYFDKRSRKLGHCHVL